MSKVQVVSELWEVMKQNKKYWLAAIVITLVLFGILLGVGKSSAFAPFISTLFYPSVASILGIAAFYHDSAACLVVDGEIIAAAQEERFTRVKHDHNFPLHAARYCLGEAALTAHDLDYVAFY